MSLARAELPALFIGRFQPFHLGHLDAITQILKKHEKIIIGIGSAQYQGTPENPFSASVREEMVRESLAAIDIEKEKYFIVHLPDIHNDEKWVAHVEGLAHSFGTVYSGTEKVQQLFKKNGQHAVEVPTFNVKISGTTVREKIARGESWERDVPNAVARIIKTLLWK